MDFAGGMEESTRVGRIADGTGCNLGRAVSQRLGGEDRRTHAGFRTRRLVSARELGEASRRLAERRSIVQRRGVLILIGPERGMSSRSTRPIRQDFAGKDNDRPSL